MAVSKVDRRALVGRMMYELGGYFPGCAFRTQNEAFRTIVTLGQPGVRAWCFDDYAWDEKERDVRVTKCYVVATPQELRMRLRDIPVAQRVFYELIVSPATTTDEDGAHLSASKLASRFYVDVDGPYTHFTDAQRRAFPEPHAMALRISRLVQRFLRRTLDLDDHRIAVRVLDASTEVKFSAHLIFTIVHKDTGREALFKSTAHVGALFRRWLMTLPREFPWYIPTKEPGVTECIADKAVYTRNRQMRLATNTKLGQARPLRARLMNGEFLGVDDTDFTEFLVQDHAYDDVAQPRRILEVTEHNGAAPDYTSADGVRLAEMRRGKRPPPSSSSSGRALQRQRLAPPQGSLDGVEAGSDVMTVPPDFPERWDAYTVYAPAMTLFAPQARLAAYQAMWDQVEPTDNFAADLVTYVAGAPDEYGGLSMRDSLLLWVQMLTGDHGAHITGEDTEGDWVIIACPTTRICNKKGQAHSSNKIYFKVDLLNAVAIQRCNRPKPGCNDHPGVKIDLPYVLKMHIYVARSLSQLARRQ
jgi:hypothetical protein